MRLLAYITAIEGAMTSAKKCPFCNIHGAQIVVAGGNIIAIADKFHVSEDHMLLIPERHVRSIALASRIA